LQSFIQREGVGSADPQRRDRARPAPCPSCPKPISPAQCRLAQAVDDADFGIALGLESVAQRLVRRLAGIRSRA
jgi:hypothetical protein